jgi:uncharacterized surface protein with fasciclin (FAS1) repeats
MINMKKIFLVILASITLFGCKKDEETIQLKTLNEYLASNPDVSIFNAAIDKAGLQTFKNGGGPFTWFMPNNTALTSIGITLDSLNRMSAGSASYFVTYHLLNTGLQTKDMIAQNSIARATQQGSPVYVGSSNGVFFVNGNKILSPDNVLSNGVVHVIGKVNIPVNLVGNIQAILSRTGQHSLFIAALTKTTRWTLFSGTTAYTVVAPTDAAMTSVGLTSAAILAAPGGTNSRLDSIVRYHYFNSARFFSNDFGNKITAQTALGAGRTIQASENGSKLKGKNNASPINITSKDILGTNGVVHIVDGVLNY